MAHHCSSTKKKKRQVYCVCSIIQPIWHKLAAKLLKNSMLSWLATSTPMLKAVNNGSFFVFVFFSPENSEKDTNLRQELIQMNHLVYSSTLNTKCCLSSTWRQAATYRTSPGRNHRHFLKLNRNRTVTFFRFVSLIARLSTIFCAILSTNALVFHHLTTVMEPDVLLVVSYCICVTHCAK